MSNAFPLMRHRASCFAGVSTPDLQYSHCDNPYSDARISGDGR